MSSCAQLTRSDCPSCGPSSLFNEHGCVSCSTARPRQLVPQERARLLSSRRNRLDLDLTSREAQVLELLNRGLDAHEVARATRISIAAVQTARWRCFAKLHISIKASRRSMTENDQALIAAARARGLVSTPSLTDPPASPLAAGLTPVSSKEAPAVFLQESP